MNSNTVIKNEIIIEGKDKKSITLDITYLEKSNNQPLVIFCHGFKGFKDWGAFNQMAEMFAKNNFIFAKFNFSHNGTSPSDYSDIHDLEAFGQNNFEIELDDLDRVLNWFNEDTNRFKNTDNKHEIYTIGHSRGGGIVMLKASEDSRIKKVVAWASVNDFEKYMFLSDTVKWKETGVSFVDNSRTGVKLPLYYQFYENFYANKNRFDLIENVMKLSIPVLLIHGTKDETVNIEDAEWIYENLDHSILVKIEGGNHAFGASHPWVKDSLPDSLSIAIDETIEFFTL